MNIISQISSLSATYIYIIIGAIIIAYFIIKGALRR